MVKESRKLQKKTVFVVVCFLPLPSPKSGKKKEVELVPASWVFVKKSEWYCRFPPTSEYHLVDKYVQGLKDSEKNWEVLKVNILSECENYEQGVKRLQRSYTRLHLDASTSNTEDVSEDKNKGHESVPKVPILTEEEASKALKSVENLEKGLFSTTGTNKDDIEKHVQDSDVAEDITEVAFDNTKAAQTTDSTKEKSLCDNNPSVHESSSFDGDNSLKTASSLKSFTEASKDTDEEPERCRSQSLSRSESCSSSNSRSHKEKNSSLKNKSNFKDDSITRSKNNSSAPLLGYVQDRFVDPSRQARKSKSKSSSREHSRSHSESRSISPLDLHGYSRSRSSRFSRQTAKSKSNNRSKKDSRTRSRSRSISPPDRRRHSRSRSSGISRQTVKSKSNNSSKKDSRTRLRSRSTSPLDRRGFNQSQSASNSTLAEKSRSKSSHRQDLRTYLKNSSSSSHYREQRDENQGQVADDAFQMRNDRDFATVGDIKILSSLMDDLMPLCDVPKAEILSKTSRCLSQAVDRDGGRSERKKKKGGN